jgi:CheY-like chemotaxis protein
MTEETSPSRSLRVLLAEDNKVNQQFATLILNKAGHSVEIAANGRQAVDALNRSDFDVVLMDIQMPELDGLQATLQIRAMPEPKRSIPIIAVTAHAMIGAREEYLAAGMDEYISKPFQPATLLSALAKFPVQKSEPSPTSVSEKSSEEIVVTPIDKLPVLDLDQLRTLASVFSLSKVRTLAALYMLDVDARLVLIEQCRSANDFDGVSRQAHMIVSTAGNLGAKQSSALACSLEVSCIKRDDGHSDALIAALHASCRVSSSALKEWLNEVTSASIAING